MAPRQYYTVIERQAGESWTPQYGSYDRQECRDEIWAIVKSSVIPPFAQFKIIASGHTQSEINKAVSLMNQA